MATTERLTITALALDDADELFAALDHPDVGRYIGGPQASSVDALRERIVRVTAGAPPERPDERWWNFTVRRARDAVVLGRVEATTYGDWGEIAYVFDPRQWGHGYATEATTWLLQELSRVGVREVWAAVVADNERSIGLLHRLAFVQREDARAGLGSYDPGDLVFSRSLSAPLHR